MNPLYQEEDAPALSLKKHPCSDCHFCQWCSEDRCRLCRKKPPAKKHLSMKEQIAFYNQLNGDIFNEKEIS